MALLEPQIRPATTPQRRGIAPQMRGRYPDHDVLAETRHWDAATREVVLERVAEPGELRYFAAAEAETLDRLCDDLLAQDREPRVPVLAMVDAKFAEGRGEGYRYSGMPYDGEVWRTVAAGLDHSAADGGFSTAPPDRRRELIAALFDGSLTGGPWRRLDVARAGSIVMRDAVGAFYAHPWAWNEIGFAGPAYPRGYSRLGVGMRESWEGEEWSP